MLLCIYPTWRWVSGEVGGIEVWLWPSFQNSQIYLIFPLNPDKTQMQNWLIGIRVSYFKHPLLVRTLPQKCRPAWKVKWTFFTPLNQNFLISIQIAFPWFDPSKVHVWIMVLYAWRASFFLNEYIYIIWFQRTHICRRSTTVKMWVMNHLYMNSTHSPCARISVKLVGVIQ